MAGRKRAALRLEQSAVEQPRPLQDAAENMHMTEQPLEELRIQRRKPVSDASTDLKRLEPKPPCCSLPPPRRPRTEGAITSNLVRSNRPTSLLEELSPDLPPTTTFLHGKPASGVDAVRPELLESSDRKLRHGMTPATTTRAKTRPAYLPRPTMYRRIRAPLPSQLQPAAPTEAAGDRAGTPSASLSFCVSLKQ